MLRGSFNSIDSSFDSYMHHQNGASAGHGGSRRAVIPIRELDFESRLIVNARIPKKKPIHDFLRKNDFIIDLKEYKHSINSCQCDKCKSHNSQINHNNTKNSKSHFNADLNNSINIREDEESTTSEFNFFPSSNTNLANEERRRISRLVRPRPSMEVLATLNKFKSDQMLLNNKSNNEMSSTTKRLSAINEYNSSCKRPKNNITADESLDMNINEEKASSSQSPTTICKLSHHNLDSDDYNSNNHHSDDNHINHSYSNFISSNIQILFNSIMLF
jgi:hypothetical protein